jgi:hypothetical protein
MPSVPVTRTPTVGLRPTLPMFLFPLPVFPIATVLLLSKRHAPQTNTFFIRSASPKKSLTPTISPGELSIAAFMAP